MAVMQLSDWFYSLKHSEITQKKIKQFYYENDVHMFFFEEIIEAVSSNKD